MNKAKPEVVSRKALIERISAQNGSTKVEATANLGVVLDAISEALQEGKKVSLSGFGSFSVQERAACVRRNPATGESVDVPAKKVVKFKPLIELAPL